MSNSNIRVRVSGPFACFTRPESKVERVSYTVMTPSAARGILDSIYWCPSIRWHIKAIEVISPILTISLSRSELKSKINLSLRKNIIDKTVAPGIEKVFEYDPAIGEQTMRNTLALKSVVYVIEAEPKIFDASKENNPQKYVEILKRRVSKGQCYRRPYLGCREFAADFSLPEARELPLAVDFDLGFMLYDIVFDPNGRKHIPVFFRGKLEKGRMETRVERVIGDEGLRRRLLACSYRR